jgi:ATP-dependent DNA helicase RecG
MPIEEIIKTGESDTVEFKTSFNEEVGFIERYGSGILRVCQICRDYGVIEPKFEELFDGFRVTLFKEKINTGELNDELNKGQKLVFNYIKKNKGIMAKNISEQLNIPYGTVDRHIRVLLNKNLIERKGSKKTGGYYAKGDF